MYYAMEYTYSGVEEGGAGKPSCDLRGAQPPSSGHFLEIRT